MKTIGLISANYVNENFGALTEKRSLASLPFGARYRLVDFVLSNMVNSGITKVGIITPYNNGSVIDHIGAGKQWSLDRKKDGLFFMPGSVYGIHTSGSRFLFRDMIDNKAYFERSDADYVIFSASSDVYNMDYTPFIIAHNESGNQITALYKKVNNAENYKGYFLNIDAEGKVKDISESTFGEADYFMDCFIADRKFVLDFIKWFSPLEYMDMFAIIKGNFEKFKIGAYEFNGYFGKVQNIADYLNISKALFDYDIRNELFHEDRTIYTKVQDDAPVRYLEGSSVKNSIVAAGCKIAGKVEGSTIFRSTVIGRNAVVKNSVIMLYSEIGEGAFLENVICDKFVKIGAGVKLIGTPEKPIVLTKGTII